MWRLTFHNYGPHLFSCISPCVCFHEYLSLESHPPYSWDQEVCWLFLSNRSIGGRVGQRTEERGWCSQNGKSWVEHSHRAGVWVKYRRALPAVSAMWQIWKILLGVKLELEKSRHKCICVCLINLQLHLICLICIPLLAVVSVLWMHMNVYISMT